MSARGDYHTDSILAQIVYAEGSNSNCVTQTTSSRAHDVFSDVCVIDAAGAEGIHLHGTKVHNWWLGAKIDKAGDC